jgi:SprT protein
MNMTNKTELIEKFASQLNRYLPDGFEKIIAQFIIEHSIRFKIVKPRATKLGDYKPLNNGKSHQITINNDLNPYSFLITSLHEIAHLKTFLLFKGNVAPHGKEWVKQYQLLLTPVINSNKLPKDIEIALVNSLINTKASSCNDLPLYRALKKYDTRHESLTLLENVPKNANFVLNDKMYVKGEIRRKRFLCKEVYSSKIYLIHALAEVTLIKEE